MELSKKEQKIISSLRKNGRESMTNIAKKHNFAISSVADSMRHLEKNNVISHTTIIDFEKAGFPHTIIANIDAGNKREEICSWLKNVPNVNTLKEINDGLDFHIEAIFKNKKQKQNFIRELKEFHNETIVQIHEVISTIKHEQFLTNHTHNDQENIRLIN